LLTVFAVLSFRQTQTWSSDETLLTRAVLLYPDSIPARLSLSVLMRQSGRYAEERSVIEAGLTYHDVVAYHTGLGSIFVREGKLDEARREYQKGRLLDPKNPEPLFFLGSLEEQQGHPEVALEDYRQAIALDDSYVAASINAGAIYLDRSDVANAENMFRSAITWNPNAWEASYNLFELLERGKKTDEAFPFLKRSYLLNPDEPDIGLAYAYRLNERGRKSEAIYVLRQLIELNPENRAATRMLEGLR